MTAILVVHNGQSWLPSTLKSLADLDERPGRLIAVDAGSTDDSPRILQEAMAGGVIARGTVMRGVLDSVREVPPDGFSRTVNDVVATLPDEDGWLWLLHDDATVHRTALTELLRVATTPNATAGPAIVIPKLLRPKLRRRPDQVQSLGETVSVSGARVVAADLDDIDQRQDESSRVVGASTAGLLVRRDAWKKLGGLSEQLPVYRAGVDLGWRANEAGLAVRTAPDAALRHQQAGLTGLRDETGQPDVDDRVAGLRVRVAHSAHPAMTALGGRLVNRVAWAGSWLAKDAAHGRLHSAVLRQFRKESAQTHSLATVVRSQPVRRLPKSLLPGPGWGIKHAADNTMIGLPTEDWSDGTINLDALTADDETVVLPRVQSRSWLGLGAAIALLVACLAACRHLLGTGPLVSAGLAPAPASLAAAWQAWLAPSGLHGANAPWLLLMALGSTLTGGQPGWWTTVLVFGGVFLAAWSAYRLVRLFVRPGVVRLALALLWACLLPVTGASSDGSPGWVILGIALPWLAIAFFRWASDPKRGLVGLRAPAAVAFATALAAVVTPALWVPVVLAAIVVAARQRDWRGLAIVVVAPLVVLGPWLPRLFDEPGRVLTGVDPVLARMASAPVPWQVLAGQVGLGSPAPLIVGCVVLGSVWLMGFAGVATFVTPSWRRWLLAAMVVALVAAVAASWVVVTIDGQQARAASLPWLLVAALVAISAGGAGWDGSLLRKPKHWHAEPGKNRKRGAVGVVRAILGALVVVVSLIGAAWWVWAGESAPLQRAGAYVPDYVTSAENSPRAVRTLVVQIVDGQANVSLRDATGPVWGSGEQSPLRLGLADRESVAAIGGQFADGVPSDDLSDRLTTLAIGYVVVIGANDTTTQAMAGVPNLVSGTNNGITVWTVGGLPSRATLVDGKTVTQLSDGTVPAGAANRQIRLAESDGLPWQVSVGGVNQISVSTSTSTATFAAPAVGGDLRWWLPLMWWVVWWTVAAVLVLVWACWPASRSAEQAATAGARRAVK